MIDEISIAGIATFDVQPEKLDALSQFNYLFGSNGTGKTTISRVIADEDSFPACKVTWKGGTKLQSMVYNRDFVERNFNQSAELKGVFTLGEKQVDTLAKIDAAKKELDALTNEIEGLNQTLQGADGAGGKRAELVELESALNEKCWAQKQKHDERLQGAFEGYRGSAEKFKGKVIQELTSNSATLLTLAELEKKAESVFGKAPTTEQSIAIIDTTKLLAHESNPILKKRVIGKEDVDIAGMIKKLGNSDWVREGRPYYEINGRVCPFCQQSTDEKFAQSLNDYFDETFETDSKAIEDLATNYETDAARVQQQIMSIIEAPSRFLDVEKMKTEKELFDSKITINKQCLVGKKKEASRIVELESVSNVIDTISSLIESANDLIKKHNDMVANISKERSMLTAQVWKYVLEELKADLASYQTARNGLNKAIESLTKQITTAADNKRKKEIEIRELERQTTSVQPTIDGINAILSSFGFQGFSIAKVADGTSYKLVRADGSDAQDTLSEGEKTFVTFLYFYHLLKGSDSESGITKDRVVVFDDPVSSLDSDILFIVGSLIKGLFDEVRVGSGHIKQVFVLTHNVYFHKEVTFNPKRHEEAMNEETFWIVRKPAHVTKIEKCPSNPIKTSYELLWSEVRNPDRSNLAIQNTLRRILENYFKILGGVDPDEITGMFEGKEKLICKSLFSWVNDGSHYAHDDLYVSIDNSTVENYLNVFRAIFDKAGHFAHYEMMMGDALVGSVNE
ncbi:MAG: AAA family ATPase [Candidatus Thiodiazotropha sp.]